MDMRAFLGEVAFPRIVRVRQKFPSPPPVEVEQEIAKQFARPEIASKIGKGKRIAIAAGSRGVAQIDRIVRAVVTQVKELGAEPFIVPAMGSHGGATAEGQANVLAHLGITEKTVGAPIRSSMEVVSLGKSPSGVPVHMDKTAYSADATIVVNRVKPHTLFRGPIESGLMKMMGIGLGKERGANAIHALGPEKFDTLIPEMGRHILKHGNIVLGVASVENAREQPVRLVAIEAERIEAEETKLQAEAKSLMPRILFPHLHVLVVQEIGKNISGDGMDPNVTGRFLSHLRMSEPIIQKLAVLDLTEQTYGNGLGLGMADVTTRRAVDKLDYYPMYVNSITARFPAAAKVPVTLDTDRDAIAAAMVSCYGVEGGVYDMMFIQNTLKLEEVYISEGLLPKARTMPNVEVRSDPFDLQFNAKGELMPLFSERD